MPTQKRKSTSRQQGCPGCGRRFFDARGLAVHLYQKQNTCGVNGIVKRKQALHNQMKSLNVPVLLLAVDAVPADQTKSSHPTSCTQCGRNHDDNTSDSRNNNEITDENDDDNTWIQDNLGGRGNDTVSAACSTSSDEESILQE